MINVGDIFTTNKCGEVRVLSYINKLVIEVEFIDTGFRKITRADVLRSGQLKDPMQSSVCGIGYLGDGRFHVSVKVGDKYKQTKEYSAWQAMIYRCYDPNRKDSKWYEEVTVCKDWHNFQTFAEWYSPRWFEGCELDKDILSLEEKIYSPDTCKLVPKETNLRAISESYYSITHPKLGTFSATTQTKLKELTGISAASLSRLLSGKTKRLRSGWEVTK